MREILFRGKRLDNGEWVEGGYKHEKVGEYLTAVFIIEHLTSGVWENHRVDPATVGQYTGLTDKNGVKIFDGDVFEWGYAGVKEFRYVVAYDAELARFVGNRGGGFVSLDGIDIEIIGNIHDNPELIGGDTP